MTQNTKRKRKGEGIFFFVILLAAFPPLVYKFKHPEMTETQLFFHFFDSYKEFFCVG